MRPDGKTVTLPANTCTRYWKSGIKAGKVSKTQAPTVTQMHPTTNVNVHQCTAFIPFKKETFDYTTLIVMRIKAYRMR